jgi:hypothetical protein
MLRKASLISETAIHMKSISITVIIFSVLAVFACNNQQSKKADDNSSEVIKTTSEKPFRKKTEETGLKDLKPCENLVKEILTTSIRYRQLTKGLNKAVVKNGGLYFGVSLEGSPNPGQDKTLSYSKTYDFTVYEMYTDRQLNTARFSFNPEKKQLYEYDAVHDQLKPIEFDRNLLLKYETLCK